MLGRRVRKTCGACLTFDSAPLGLPDFLLRPCKLVVVHELRGTSKSEVNCHAHPPFARASRVEENNGPAGRAGTGCHHFLKGEDPGSRKPSAS